MEFCEWIKTFFIYTNLLCWYYTPRVSLYRHQIVLNNSFFEEEYQQPSNNHLRQPNHHNFFVKQYNFDQLTHMGNIIATETDDSYKTKSNFPFSIRFCVRFLLLLTTTGYWDSWIRNISTSKKAWNHRTNILGGPNHKIEYWLDFAETIRSTLLFKTIPDPNLLGIVLEYLVVPKHGFGLVANVEHEGEISIAGTMDSVISEPWSTVKWI